MLLQSRTLSIGAMLALFAVVAAGLWATSPIGRRIDGASSLLGRSAQQGVTEIDGNRYATPLHRAAALGDTVAMESLIAAGARIDVAGSDGRSPLSLAASQGYVSAERLLIKSGAKIDHADREGMTPLMEAAKGGYATDLLRREQADPRDLALAESIVLGCLRHQSQLDHLITVFSGKTAKLDPEVRTILRMGIFQLRYLDRIPAHAAVAEHAVHYEAILDGRADQAIALGYAHTMMEMERNGVPLCDTWAAGPAVALRRPDGVV
mgnify:CR=1 FL=1